MSYIQEILDNEFAALNYLLMSVIRRFSLKEAVENKKTCEIYYQITESENYLQRDQSLCNKILEIKNKLICQSCKVNIVNLIFECSHTLCEACFRYYTENIDLPQTKYERVLTCPFCSRAIKECEYSHIYENFKDMAMLRDKRERIQTNDPISCITCKRKLAKKCYSGCCCRCFECQSENRTLGFCECGTFTVQINCDACKCRIDPVNNKFVIFCDGHTHCQNCINKTCNKLECQVCTSTLRGIDLEKIYTKAFQTCCFCNGTFNAKYFLSKNCCQYLICAMCQYKKNQTYCVCCSAILNPSPQDFLRSQNLLA
ncbi:hypothetical protein SteCoe_12803 [Stentor coeruleus]|uniref:RING-type domain-containing protein n=1 Tax=Stentor coeruleus TaxID=5963 RepID=A0A1R2C9W8_9CILI|nr:hypothetical protein SteCoe_12803 [Stentor coeruleus]